MEFVFTTINLIFFSDCERRRVRLNARLIELVHQRLIFFVVEVVARDWIVGAQLLFVCCERGERRRAWDKGAIRVELVRSFSCVGLNRFSI